MCFECQRIKLQWKKIKIFTFAYCQGRGGWPHPLLTVSLTVKYPGGFMTPFTLWVYCKVPCHHMKSKPSMKNEECSNCAKQNTGEGAVRTIVRWTKVASIKHMPLPLPIKHTPHTPLYWSVVFLHWTFKDIKWGSHSSWADISRETFAHLSIAKIRDV